VLSTRWSTWLGVPIALPGAMIYASVLAAVWFLGPNVPGAVRRAAWWILLTLTAVAALAATWFIGLQALAIGSFCWPCLATHASGLLLAAAAWSMAVLGTRSVGLPLGRSALAAGGVAALAVGVLVAGQLTYEPQTFVVERGKSPKAADTDSTSSSVQPSNGSDATQTPSAESTAHTAAKPALSRVLKLQDTAITVDAYEQPILGSPDAEHVIVKLFDYTCHYCRDQHFRLEGARRKLGGRLAVVVLPVPMNRHCNQFATSYGDGPNEKACVYARLALAVWHADRTKFAEFHHWLFEPEKPPPVEDVRERVRELVGQAGLGWADDSPEPRREIEKYTEIYGSYENPKIPKLIDEHFVIVGEFRDAEQLVEVLEEEWRKAK
jgi:protein-disulfide isomerase